MTYDTLCNIYIIGHINKYSSILMAFDTADQAMTGLPQVVCLFSLETRHTFFINDTLGQFVPMFGVFTYVRKHQVDTERKDIQNGG